MELTTVAEVQLIYRTKLKASDRPRIHSSRDAYQVFWDFYDHDTIEHTETVSMLVLNKANRVLGAMRLSTGGITGCIIDTRIVFQTALKANATAIILCHNHPSGNVYPSEADLQVTKKIKAGGKYLDIDVLDHIIITPEGQFHSMADNGQL